MAPSLKRLYLVQEAGQQSPQGLGPASAVRKQVAKGNIKPGDPGWGSQQPPEQEDPQKVAKDVATEKSALEGHVKQFLGSDQEPGKSLMSVAAELAEVIAKSSDPSFVSKIEGSFKDMLSKARLVRQGKARAGESVIWGDLLEMIQLSEDSKAIELIINRYAKKLIGLKDEGSAARILRTAISAAMGGGQAAPEKGAAAAQGGEGQPAGQDMPKTAAAGNPAAATGQVPSKIGRGGDARKIMAALMKALPAVKKMEVTQPLATGLIRSASKLSMHLATNPASSPDKVKIFVKAWNSFISDISSFVPRKV